MLQCSSLWEMGSCKIDRFLWCDQEKLQISPWTEPPCSQLCSQNPHPKQTLSWPHKSCSLFGMSYGCDYVTWAILCPFPHSIMFVNFADNLDLDLHSHSPVKGHLGSLLHTRLLWIMEAEHTFGKHISVYVLGAELLDHTICVCSTLLQRPSSYPKCVSQVTLPQAMWESLPFEQFVQFTFNVIIDIMVSLHPFSISSTCFMLYYFSLLIFLYLITFLIFPFFLYYF